MSLSRAASPPAAIINQLATNNLDRTREHSARVDERRRVLADELAGILPSPTSLICEVGCGHGHFLTAYAKAHPDRMCLGLDLLRDRIVRARRKAQRAKLANLHFILAEAREFLEALPSTATLSAIYVLFPDPWPKRRHHKHRLLQSSFLNSLAARAEEGARLYFRTEHEPYFAAAAAAVSSNRHWGLNAEPWPFELETVFQARAPTYHSFVAIKKAAHKLGDAFSHGG
jgi:tRNA (guanine-N7-)-methyltransferase